MLPEPLHPAVVHFPMVLVVLLPIAALLALWAIRRGRPARWTWAVPLGLSAALALSAWVALQTGEAEEERVERVVSESALHEHEEAGERFFLLSGVLLLIAAAGMAGGTLGRAGRILSTVGSIGLVYAGVQVGAAGGELVYEHGAASAYVQDGAAGGDGAGGALLETDDDDD
jgi:uncharacterized membrane protein